ncbi:MAG: LysM peptidoglycan-binding domain-containing protein [Candidatus Limnocylindrales bacterium]
MTERGLPSVDGAPACPFVAFEDDRESRSTSPDHRHRCFAEPLPAPRAAAHQEAYCLSSAFPVCPTFQDWARREAVHARGEGERPAPAPSAIARTSAAATPPDRDSVDDDEDDEHESEASAGHHATSMAEEPAPAPAPLEEPTIRRNPPRDWAAPPPWATGGPAGPGSRRPSAGTGAVEGTGPPQFLAGRSDESRGLAGSAADRLASGVPGSGPDALSPSFVHATGAPSSAAAPPDAELADLVGPARPGDRPVHGHQPAARPGNRPRVSSTRSAPPRDAIVGPAWERSRRFEAYPTIRTRVGIPQLPRLAVLAVAVAIAAVGLFFLPALLGVGGGGDGGTSTASPSTSQGVASSSPGPSVSVAPTAQVYVVKAGDTMSKVAARYGLTTDQLCAANKSTIKNCDKIAIGDELVIPTTAPDVINDASATPSAS